MPPWPKIRKLRLMDFTTEMVAEQIGATQKAVLRAERRQELQRAGRIAYLERELEKLNGSDIYGRPRI